MELTASAHSQDQLLRALGPALGSVEARLAAVLGSRPKQGAANE
jgi:hypothetical protein